MFHTITGSPIRALWAGVLCGTLGLTAGCTANTTGADPFDPYETRNRKVHEFNKNLDKKLFRSSNKSESKGSAPRPLKRGVTNFAANLDRPRTFINNVLQGDIDSAVRNFFNFAINSTLGVGGIFDPASDIGVSRQDTDFGETLHVWGVGEGAYVELPLLGPSTERDVVGDVVDRVINPVRLLGGNERKVATVANIGAKLAERDDLSGVADDILDDSADSYAQLRLLYLQNRRFELGGRTVTEEDYFDPYEDPYAQ